MPGLLEPFKDWFGYDRKERRASIILLLLILSVLIIRMTYPGNKTEIVDITSEYTIIKTVNGKEISSNENKISYGNFESERVKRDRNELNLQKSHIIELNSCDSASLERLYGIGPVLSARIIKYRNLIGGFVSVDQLRDVYGLSPETFERIKGKIDVDPSRVRKVNINTADYNELAHLPYLKKYHLVALVKYREVMDSIVSIEELIENKIIPDSIAIKVRAYMVF